MLIRAFYTALLFIVSPFLLMGLYKKKNNKPPFGSRWKEHFGFTPRITQKREGKPIWIHAVSVGESIAATPLIKAIKEKDPEQVVVVTTTTSTGAAQISKLGSLVEHRYMPIDFSFAIKGFLRAIQPKQMLIIETELWPNTLNTVHKAGIPITVVNARLSKKSCSHYKRVQPLFNLMIPCLDKLLCQSASDEAHFTELGVPQDKLAVTGSIKFDLKIPENAITEGNHLRAGIGENRPVWIAASTHPKEDEIVLSAHSKLLKHIPSALLIIVPRHPERFEHVSDLITKSGFTSERRSQCTQITPQTQVYLADTMGEMLTLLQASDACFMGGSLIGEKVGGHNVLEPAALGIPIVNGPSYYNFNEVVPELIKRKLIKISSNDVEIADTIGELLTNKEMSINHQQELKEFVSDFQGSISRTLNFVYKNI
ncbi:3-deoxy-D-manno-octulosonic acid transferase [Vibrio rotiferianus]|uniref:3-deoxy-D-manno-octulosonic acid transferase n=1 Tax=Vibrio rotiferianus TaxID=190895 RepID=A0ABX3D471_9VIBR|nr:lipid IV(A) 3-deoxy-D-manno-octulosonic acid transferase [Vibrio rotiferianus]OHY90007.1 3-deoxy-D-manno-octulosonic acid transferase [Vibrio rotiferianus]